MDSQYFKIGNKINEIYMKFFKIKALECWEMLKNHWDSIETKQGLMWFYSI